MAAVDFRQIDAVPGLCKQLFLRKFAGLQVKAVGRNGNIGGIAGLVSVAGALDPGLGRGLQVVQQGAQGAVFNNGLGISGHAFPVEPGLYRTSGIKGIVDQRDAGGSDFLPFPAFQQRQSFLGLVGGEYRAENSQQVGHNLRVQNNGVFPTLRHFCTNGSGGFFHRALGQLLPAHLGQGAHPVVVAVVALAVLFQNSPNDAGLEAGDILKIQTFGIAQTGDNPFRRELAGSAVADPRIGVIGLGLAVQNKGDHGFRRGKREILIAGFPVGVPGGVDEHLVGVFNGPCVLHGPFHNGFRLLLIQEFRGGVAHFAVCDAPEAGAPGNAVVEPVDLPLVGADGDALAVHVIKLIVCQAQVLGRLKDRFLEKFVSHGKTSLTSADGNGRYPDQGLSHIGGDGTA